MHSVTRHVATLRSRAIAPSLLLVLFALLLTPACGLTSDAATKAPDFQLVTYTAAGILPDGQGSFASVLNQDKPVVLNFWGGDCPPCRAEMPDFQKVADEYQGQVIFLGVDVGPFTQLGSHESARQLLKDLNITYPTAYAVDDAPVRDYNLGGVPTTVLITKEHTIEKTNTGIMSRADLESAVKSLVSK